MAKSTSQAPASAGKVGAKNGSNGQSKQMDRAQLAFCALSLFGAWAFSRRDAGVSDISLPAVSDISLPAVSDISLPAELRKLVRCGEICDIGVSSEDRKFAEGAARKREKDPRWKHVEAEHTEHLIKVCMFRCQVDIKAAHENHGMAPADKYMEMPAALRDFAANAKQCVAADVRGPDDVVSGLRQCGVVHLNDAVSVDLLAQVHTAYNSIRSSSTENAMFTDTGNLRGGRLETWVPFRPPFNHTTLLQMPKLMAAIKSYLGPEAVLDHVTVITASGKSAREPQEAHADVGVARQHLEVHLPLVDVSPAMGPTRFCPGSHGFVQKGKAGWKSGVEGALSQYYFAPGAHCAGDAAISYARPLKVGQATMYDANVFHGGTANHAGKERPILQLSYSASPTATAERDYLHGSFEGKQASKALVVESAESFRMAFEENRGRLFASHLLS